MGIQTKIEQANQIAVERLIDSQPVWVDVAPALEVLEGMHNRLFLYSGPPISWDNMCQPQKNAIYGAMIFEGLSKTKEEAEHMCNVGEIEIAPNHEYGAVGPMTGIISPSMNVYVVENTTYNTRGHCVIYEGSGVDRLNWGICNPAVVENLHWIHGNVSEGLKAGLRSQGNAMPLKPIISRALQMGDDLHGRNHASSAIFAMQFMPALINSLVDNSYKYDVARFLLESNADGSGSFLHLAMASCKAIADAAKGVEYSTILTTIARNGVEVGIKISAMGEEWFTGPAQPINGLFVAPYTSEDAQNDMGDSAIVEICGLGGMAAAAAPSLALTKTGDAQNAIRLTKQMQQICQGVNGEYSIPSMNGAGAPLGIDLRLVVDQGILPEINTGIAAKTGGRIGIGNAKPPMSAFKDALRAFAQKYN